MDRFEAFRGTGLEGVHVLADVALVHADAVFDAFGAGRGVEIDGCDVARDLRWHGEMPVIDAVVFAAGDEAAIHPVTAGGELVDDVALVIAEDHFGLAVEAEEWIEAGGADLCEELATFPQRHVDADEVRPAVVDPDFPAVKAFGELGRAIDPPQRGNDREQAGEQP